MTKYNDIETASLTCKIFDNIECRGIRSFYVEIPCIK